MTLTVGSLFAGIGGFDLGLERAGMRVVWQSEIDPYASAVLRKHWPGIPNLGDIRAMRDVPYVDVICGGFPCQDISVAGKGAGIDGERSGLWREYARIVGEVRPRFVIVENVAALLGRGLGRVLGDLAALGYDAEWHCIPASAAGAPQRRDRLWIIAHTGGQQHESGSNAQRRAGAAGFYESDLADALRSGRDEAFRYEGRMGSQERGQEAVKSEPVGASEAVALSRPLADAHKPRLEGRAHSGDARGIGARLQQQLERCPDGIGTAWFSEPDVGRVAHGVPARVDRLRCLGNAVVPQVVEIIGRAIVESEAACSATC